jgi:hypothetical protein
LPISAVYHALDSITEPQHVEVDQEAHRNSAEAHVGQKLGFVDWMDRLYGFHFDDDLPLYDQIDSISNFELLTFVYHRQRSLRSDLQASIAQFVSEARLVGTLEQSGAEDGVNLHG